jgi:methyl-accepting chemotaxis protein
MAGPRVATGHHQKSNHTMSIRFNRIGNKLGLVSLFGILLSIGMVANQIWTDSTVTEANRRADIQQQISENALKAESEMRNMQLGIRGVRLARTPAEVNQRNSEFLAAQSVQAKMLDASIALALSPETREQFAKLKASVQMYSEVAEQQVQLQLKLLDLHDKRVATSAEWDRRIEKLYALFGAGGLPDRSAAEINLRDADGAMSAGRAAGWQFFSTGEADQKEKIARNAAIIAESLQRARGSAVDKAQRDGIESLEPLVGEFVTTSQQAIEADDFKNTVSTTRTTPLANRVAELLRTTVTVAQKAVADAKADASDKMVQAGRVGAAFGAVIVLVLLGSMIFSSMSIARPITGLNAALGRMAAGELNIEIPGANRGDEVGDMAKTVVVIRENAEKKARDEADAKIRHDQFAAQQRKADMVSLANDFEGAVGEIVETVSSASTELEASADTLTSTAERAQELATIVAAASEEASTNVQSVASATEELTSSVNEISRQVQESARMASEAVDQARKTNDRVGELSKAAARIGDVVELINTIAGQTNLLALNATIEAARAGEAGRGFAVVASEVKALAEQTAKATGEIGQQIAGIQAATQDSVGAIKEISGTIKKLSEISSTIAAAVEEQGAATQEISRNVQQAAQGTMEVSSNIADVKRGAGETGLASSQVLSAAQSLSGDSNRLKLEVGKFLNSVRAA